MLYLRLHRVWDSQKVRILKNTVSELFETSRNIKIGSSEKLWSFKVPSVINNYNGFKGGLPSLCSGFPEKIDEKLDFFGFLVLMFSCFLGMSGCMKRFKNSIYMIRNDFSGTIVYSQTSKSGWVDRPNPEKTIEIPPPFHIFNVFYYRISVMSRWPPLPSPASMMVKNWATQPRKTCFSCSSVSRKHAGTV